MMTCIRSLLGTLLASALFGGCAIGSGSDDQSIVSSPSGLEVQYADQDHGLDPRTGLRVRSGNSQSIDHHFRCRLRTRQKARSPTVCLGAIGCMSSYPSLNAPFVPTRS